MKKWLFNDSESTAVICNKKIVNDGVWIAYVSHDEDDAGWQFHTADNEVTEGDALVVSLKNIVDIDDSVTELADLPLGWQAWRDAKSSSWQRSPRNS